MKKFPYYYEPKALGDPNAVRFETDAKPLARYSVNCERLTYPYTPLTWLMVDFIKNHYLSDPEGFLSNSPSFWDEASKSPMFQYETRINRVTGEVGRYYCSRVVEIYRDLKSCGFNLAKPIPVAENPKGHIVPLKGAKRIAGLLSLGISRVPVLEYDRRTLSNMTPKQGSTTCIDHASLIFNQLGDLPGVQALRDQYQFPMDTSEGNNNPTFDEALKSLVADRGGNQTYTQLYEQPVSLANISSFNALEEKGSSLAFGINQNWETLLWLYRRGLCKHFILVDHEAAERLAPLAQSAGITLHFNANGAVDIQNAGLAEICLLSNLPHEFRIDGLESVNSVLIVDQRQTISEYE